MTADGRRPSDGGGRMRDVTHAHADHDPRAWHWFARGPTVAADGGERTDGSRTSSDGPSGGGRRGADEREGRPTDRDGERTGPRPVEEAGPRNVEHERIRDVSHEPNSGVDANRVWERGEADRDEVAK